MKEEIKIVNAHIILMVEDYMQDNDLKQKDLAQLLKISEAQVSRLIRGTRTFTLSDVVLLSDLMGISIDELVGNI